MLPGLLSTRSEFPFRRGPITSRAFVVRASPDANFLVYGSSLVKDYQDHIREIGGITAQVVGHRDEASKFHNAVGAPLWCHDLEERAVEANGARVAHTFSGSKHVFLADEDGTEVFAAYHTPGHTDGSSSFLWKNRDHGFSVLFTGDALSIESPREIRASLKYHYYENNVRDQIRTLELIRELEPTYIVPALSVSEHEEFVYPYKELAIEPLLEQLTEAQAERDTRGASQA